MYTIIFIAKEDLNSIVPLLELLNPKLEPSIIEQRLEKMKSTSYQCIGVFDGQRLVGISGIWMLNKIYSGKHIEPDNVVIHPNYRNQKVGEQLMEWIHEFGIANGCNTSELNCFVSNTKGHKFWINQGYEIIGFHMIKKLQAVKG